MLEISEQRKLLGEDGRYYYGFTVRCPRLYADAIGITVEGGTFQ
jgi:hypothetical protein